MLYPLTGLALAGLSAAACISSGDQNTINSALKSGGAGAVVQLCASAVIKVTGSISFTAANQELSTQGYPTGSTRAIIRLATTDQTVSAIIHGGGLSGIKIKNIQVDGDRSANGMITQGSSSANIEVGGTQNGLVVDHVASMNPRGWSCMHVSEGSAASGSSSCTNATITNNDIGPCGQAGKNSAGQGQWADGISFACSESLVQSNTVTGSTDGGIVLFGAPGTKVLSNTVQGSTTEAGFGGINLVDDLAVYNGSFANVEVSGNTIHGEHLFGAGVAMGSCAWTSCTATSIGPFLKGPVSVTNNEFTGNIVFPIPISGWTGGLTVTGNTLTGLTANSAYAGDSNCFAPTQSLFAANDRLIINTPSVTGSTTLQSGFIKTTNYPSYFICPSPL